MLCPRCQRENDESNKFCTRCGLNFSEFVPQPVLNSDEAKFCYRHKKEPTLLSCGRCGNPICTKCVKMGPAGPRCPDCAKMNIATRPGAVWFNMRQSVSRVFSGAGRQSPWMWYVLFIIVSSLVGGIGRYGCGRERHQLPPTFENIQEEKESSISSNESP